LLLLWGCGGVLLLLLWGCGGVLLLLLLTALNCRALSLGCHELQVPTRVPSRRVAFVMFTRCRAATWC
jgi:hypothetical protein